MFLYPFHAPFFPGLAQHLKWLCWRYKTIVAKKVMFLILFLHMFWCRKRYYVAIYKAFYIFAHSSWTIRPRSKVPPKFPTCFKTNLSTWKHLSSSWVVFLSFRFFRKTPIFTTPTLQLNVVFHIYFVMSISEMQWCSSCLFWWLHPEINVTRGYLLDYFLGRVQWLSGVLSSAWGFQATSRESSKSLFPSKKKVVYSEVGILWSNHTPNNCNTGNLLHVD